MPKAMVAEIMQKVFFIFNVFLSKIQIFYLIYKYSMKKTIVK